MYDIMTMNKDLKNHLVHIDIYYYNEEKIWHVTVYNMIHHRCSMSAHSSGTSLDDALRKAMEKYYDENVSLLTDHMNKLYGKPEGSY